VRPAVGIMLKQEDLAFRKAISTVQPSPALLRELRKALASKKTAKAARPRRLEWRS
jgi:ribosomal protein L29